METELAVTDAEFVRDQLWKVANTARKEVAEEIATAIEALVSEFDQWGSGFYREAAAKAREIGAKRD